jgi:plasmid maintenance system antidote protein VapI
MAARRLVPSQWSRKAGVPMGEVMAFLTGRSREISAGTAAKLAEAAGVAPEELFRS